MSKLVIVESPAKARTVSKILGAEYQVEASVGHVRDLAQPSNLPEKEKHGPFAKFAVDVDGDFTPYYVINSDKKQTVKQLKDLLKQSDELILATDEDREGEAIAWHLLEVLKPKVPVKRMVFHEITSEAVNRAIEATRNIDLGLVDAQETRRILDRLVGYEISPLLWRKVAPGLSAGRVQSVATRLVVERERERMAFQAAEYWSIEVDLATRKEAAAFSARLSQIGTYAVAQGRDLGDDGQLTSAAAKKQVVILDEAQVTQLANYLQVHNELQVSNLESKPYRRRPSAPFTTSTLQQEASRKLGLSARNTMQLAQSLYENGYITYMRTDSTTLSTQALRAARAQAQQLFGQGCVPDSPRVYGTQTKGAQEAHEAIRPAGEEFRHPKELSGHLGKMELALYELIWKRTLASQMIDATGMTATLTLEAQMPIALETLRIFTKQAHNEELKLVFSAAGTVITEPGFRQIYEEGRDKDRYDSDKESKSLPNLEVGENVQVVKTDPSGHTTRPPERYTDASIVKKMEELGIGRPSTYASTITRIIARAYVERKGQTLIPTWIAFSVTRLLEENLPDLINYAFTADMESALDRIALGVEKRTVYLSEFWRGNTNVPGLKQQVESLGDIDAKAVNSIEIGQGITLRVGKYGPYVEKDGLNEQAEKLRATVPSDLPPDELTVEAAEELFKRAASDGRVLGKHPETGLEIIAKDGRYGAYVSEELPDDAPENAKPRTAGLFKTMDLETITLEQAVELLSLPRLLGKIDGQEVYAKNGRYGPFLTKGSETRSLETEAELISIDLPTAEALFAAPKQRRGAKAATSLAKDMGVDPVTGKAVTLKDGRFGPYVTDGEINASLRTADSVETITPERAWELLALRREKIAEGGLAKGRVKKSSAKKTTTKKTTVSKKTVSPKKSTDSKKAAE